MERAKRSGNLIIVVEQFPRGYGDGETFHVNVEISTDNYASFERPLRESSERYLARIGPLGEKIVRDLFAIKGISKISICPYEVRITIGEAFSWEKIRSKVEAILHKHCDELADAAQEQVAEQLEEDPHDRICRGLESLNKVWEKSLLPGYLRDFFGNYKT